MQSDVFSEKFSAQLYQFMVVVSCWYKITLYHRQRISFSHLIAGGVLSLKSELEMSISCMDVTNELKCFQNLRNTDTADDFDASILRSLKI